MLCRVSYRKAETASGTATIILEDGCQGAFFYLKPRGCDLYASFVLFTILCYEAKNISVNKNLTACIRHILIKYGVNSSYLQDVILRDWSKVCPSISFNKYYPLITKFIIPQILRE